MQRILFVTDSLMAGGIESQLTELATRLDHRRFEPHVACLYGPPIREAHFAPRLREHEIPIHFLSLDLSPQAKIVGVARIVALIRSLRPAVVQAENYHANLLTRLAYPLLLPFAPRFSLIGSVRVALSPKQLFYERLSHPFCRAIVVNAPQLGPMLTQRAAVPASKIVFIPNGIDLQRFSASPGQSARYRPSDATRVFLTIGRISADKNIHLTAQAFGLLRRQGALPDGVRLIIVGMVQEAAAQRLIDEAIQRDGLHDIVLQEGPTAQPEAAYPGCDACIVFSSPVNRPGEGLPSVMIEAMAAGRPVIASENANAAGVVVEGVNGWIVPTHDVARLAERIKAVLAMPDSALDAMRDACIQTAARFSVEQMVMLQEALFERLSSPVRR